jgi:hypothetical protein
VNLVDFGPRELLFAELISCKFLSKAFIQLVLHDYLGMHYIQGIRQVLDDSGS